MKTRILAAAFILSILSGATALAADTAIKSEDLSQRFVKIDTAPVTLDGTNFLLFEAPAVSTKTEAKGSKETVRCTSRTSQLICN